jgi:hypothetical protein
VLALPPPTLSPLYAAAALLGLAVLATGAGCAGGGKTPEQAYQHLGEAVTARDPLRLYDALDLDTRWSWMSVQRAQRESYDIVLSNFPEGHERERALRRFEAGAHSESARDLFARELDPAVVPELAARLAAAGAAPRIAVQGERAEVAAGGAMAPLGFRKGAGGRWGWGYAGLADRGEQAKQRALADLEGMRSSAAEYERAAARASR